MSMSMSNYFSHEKWWWMLRLQKFSSFLLITYCRYIYCTTVFKDNQTLRSHKSVEIKIFSLIFCLERSGSGSVQIIKDPDPDPGGPKTFGPYRSRSGHLILMTRPYHSGLLSYIFWLTAVYYTVCRLIEPHGRMNYKDTEPYMSAFLLIDLLTDFAACA